MLELVVHRVSTRHRRTGVNMTLDTTVGEEGVAVYLLSEDQAGDFSVIKLDSRVKEGRELESLVWVQLGGGSR